MATVYKDTLTQNIMLKVNKNKSSPKLTPQQAIYAGDDSRAKKTSE